VRFTVRRRERQCAGERYTSLAGRGRGRGCPEEALRTYHKPLLIPVLGALMLTACATGTTNQATDITASAATLRGTIIPDGDSGRWRFEYKRASATTMSMTAWVNVSSDVGSTTVSTRVSDLQAATRYAFRLCGEETTGTRPTNAPDRLPYSCAEPKEFTTTANDQCSSAAGPASNQGCTPPPSAARDFPRLMMTHYLVGSLAEAQRLARWDWVVASGQVRDVTPQYLDDVKAANPNLKITSNVSGIEDNSSENDPRYCSSPNAYVTGFSDQWWLKNADGSFANLYGSGRKIINPTEWAPLVNGKRWNEHLARWLSDCYTQGGVLSDGVFLDMTNDTSLFNEWPGWTITRSDRVPNIDMNRNGVRDVAEWGEAETNNRWGAAMRDLMSKVRAAIGPDKLAVTNSGNGSSFYPWGNGQSYEHGSSPANGVFNDSMIRMMQKWDANHYGSQYSTMQSQAGSAGAQTNYHYFRHNLAATLMTNSYFSHGCGAPCNYADFWWYDEYSVDPATAKATGDASKKGYLGQPTGPAVRLSNGVWRRDFDNGIALANNTSSTQTVSLGGTFRRIQGTQDPSVNNGASVSSQTLAPQDGIILLR
jgi:Hypothetical glycosyl hydrolase family 15